MTLLLPLGLLGLLSIVALIIIYIIKPNYQQKAVSSTYIWKLSLKYRKKRIPTSKLRNLLIILCQILILTLLAFIMSQPSCVLKEQIDEAEIIAIIDASSSMRTVDSDGVSRFNRAVAKVTEKAEETFENNGIVSVIFSDDSPGFISQRSTNENKNELLSSLDGLVEEDACTYGVADINGALLLCEELLEENPSARIIIYTDNEYAYVPDGIEVEMISDGSEWNAAILNAYAELEDNYYNFVVDVACYGRNADITVNLEIYGANAADLSSVGSNINFQYTVRCEDDATMRLLFRNADKEMIDVGDENTVLIDIFDADKIFSYQSIHVSINENDSYQEDNGFDIYGGQKEVLKILYSSPAVNPFFTAALDNLRTSYSDRWDIKVTEWNADNIHEEGFKTEGYDIYIYEHLSPEVMPKDGLVIFCDPDIAPNGAGFRVNSYYDLGRNSMPLQSGYPHQLMNNILAENITVTRFSNITYLQPNYEVLMSFDGRPVLMAKNDGPEQVVILGLNLHYSNFPITLYFPMLLSNILNYYLPATVVGNAFEVNQTISVNSRGNELTVEGYKTYKTYYEFPAAVKLDTPGMYTLSQSTYFGDDISETIYVKVPASESNIWNKEDTVYKIQTSVDPDSFYEDLLLYFAIALVALLFAEWWLNMRGSNV